MIPNSLPHYHLPSNALKDKVILITGAGRGLGREIALAAALHGATTILLGSSLKKLEALYDEMMDKQLPEPALQPMNFLGIGPKELNDMAQSIHSMFGRLDGIVHNAATVGQVCPLENLSPQKWLQATHVNLNIPFMLTHAVMPLLRQSNRASIIFTADSDVLNPIAYWGAYQSSKIGLINLAKTFAEELESTKINVNTVYPPHLRTALRVNHYPGINPADFTAPQTIANDFVYLLSNQCTAHGEHFSLSATMSAAHLA